MKITKGLTWPFLLLAFAALMVFLGGLASLQHGCYSRGGFPGPFTPGTTTANAAFGLSSGFNTCNHIFRFHWFTFAFVLLTLLGLMITAAIGAGLHFSRPFWIGMLAISTVLMMMMSEIFLGHKYLFEGTSDLTWYRRWQTATAGAIMTVVGLVLAMLAVGTDWEHRKGAGRYDDKAHTGIAGVAVPVQNVRVVEQV